MGIYINLLTHCMIFFSPHRKWQGEKVQEQGIRRE